MARRLRYQALTSDGSVSELELFFDLVFVFALTRVTDLLARDLTGVTVLHSTMVLAVMWWTWVGYSWLGNVARADHGIVKMGMFAAMGASLILALTIPEAFTDIPGGLPGPMVFAVGYAVVRILHWVIFWVVARDHRALRHQLLRWAGVSVVPTMVLFIMAATTSGTAQTVLWATALACDYVGTLAAGTDWRLNSPRHFAERHGLIVIVALGESIVSIGIGVADLPISWPIVIGALLALTVCGSLWLFYFGLTATTVEHALTQATANAQVTIARSCYTFMHLPMVVGIIGLSLGLKKVLGYVGGDDGHTLRDSLHGIPLLLMFGGVALYLTALTGFRYLGTGTVRWVPVLTTGVVLALLPLADALPALATLGLLTATLVIAVAYETLKSA